MKVIILTSAAVFGALYIVHPQTERHALFTSVPGHATVENENDPEARLDVRLAEAKLSLAKVELRRARETNRRIPGTIPPGTLERLEQAVKLGNKQLAYSKGEVRELHAVHLLQLEGEVELANRQLKAALAANTRAPDSFNATSIERLRLQADVARLTLARAREPGNFASVHAHVQWQLDSHYEEIQRLRNEIGVLLLRK